MSGVEELIALQSAGCGRTTGTAVVAAAEAHVKEAMAAHDASHDYAHIARVREVALRLAEMEGIEDGDELEVIELAALLHDLHDYKYSGSLTAGAEAAAEFLAGAGMEAERAAAVVDIINSVGFKNEVGGRVEVKSVAHGVVQDADRLDAIGALGIARTFSYGGRKGRPFYSMAAVDADADAALPASGLTTEEDDEDGAGRELAAGRHAFMEAFLTQFYAEARGDA
ncbi:metal dependent phosphohydrolase [Thecamonas trahens ATCC 50062]|uniref:Metal dependent phosphohydrolase n=1 Tax=Thecamonas trahens ATCC 50062 TaxID=461836 RepID=A0A0L0D6H6_THETB|nr:metal dependent phosphohydrolase [Thecamonas trahens ATCC 50062]KNC47954.1 metal dependent phosphohydrolase [Thecamonas trahens ATCC 50062]|eukprot:XP_013758971.1 metal dependent phosphohydrolase [Thecamonas trahens ATCC 50062]